ncbi:PstS family phosphate ABC transporter substrate-binding protein [Altericista sp. CCNU0014]|uniref:PstS family phosphate ABC transporter substrate-binding protein n=1 Tax=Altericista sp. CCNU0014 TaxID=3082949 RepID=UPI00384EE3CC
MTNDFNFVKCPKCEHDRNPVTATKCEICGTALKKGSLPIAPILVGVGLLGILGAGGFLLKDMFSGSKPSAVSSPSVTTTASPPAVPVTAPENPDSAQVKGAVVQTYPKLSDVPNVPQGIFNYGGSTTFAPLRSPTILSQFSTVFPQYQLRYTEPLTGKPGSGKGIEMLIDGQLSIAQSSRSPKDEEFASAKSRGFALDSVPVAIDGIALFVTPSLISQGVKGLSLNQVRDIFTDKIQNWQAVGGPNLKITPVSRDPSAGGTVDFFVENVLENQPLGTDVKIARDATDSIRQTSAAPGGIGFATASELINQRTIRLLPIAKGSSQSFVSPCSDETCTSANEKAFADGSYPVTRRLFVVLKRDGKLDEQAGVAYANLLLSDEGQQLVKKAGFVPIR